MSEVFAMHIWQAVRPLDPDSTPWQTARPPGPVPMRLKVGKDETAPLYLATAIIEVPDLRVHGLAAPAVLPGEAERFGVRVWNAGDFHMPWQ